MPAPQIMDFLVELIVVSLPQITEFIWEVIVVCQRHRSKHNTKMDWPKMDWPLAQIGQITDH